LPGIHGDNDAITRELGVSNACGMGGSGIVVA
jgi:hypothetical protein